MFVETKKEGEAPTKPAHPSSEALLIAAEFIERKGHCVGQLGNERIGLCMVGAISMAFTGRPDGIIGPFGIDAFERVTKVIGAHNIGAWNDNHTAAEAIAALRAAAQADK